MRNTSPSRPATALVFAVPLMLAGLATMPTPAHGTPGDRHDQGKGTGHETHQGTGHGHHTPPGHQRNPRDAARAPVSLPDVPEPIVTPERPREAPQEPPSVPNAPPVPNLPDAPTVPDAPDLPDLPRDVIDPPRPDTPPRRNTLVLVCHAIDQAHGHVPLLLVDPTGHHNHDGDLFGLAVCPTQPVLIEPAPEPDRAERDPAPEDAPEPTPTSDQADDQEPTPAASDLPTRTPQPDPAPAEPATNPGPATPATLALGPQHTTALADPPTLDPLTAGLVRWTPWLIILAAVLAVTGRDLYARARRRRTP